jgi:hypothetical protein
MRPLQDQCYPTPLPKLDEMLRKDMGLRYAVSRCSSSSRPRSSGSLTLDTTAWTSSSPTLTRPRSASLPYVPFRPSSDLWLIIRGSSPKYTARQIVVRAAASRSSCSIRISRNSSRSSTCPFSRSQPRDEANQETCSFLVLFGSIKTVRWSMWFVKSVFPDL